MPVVFVHGVSVRKEHDYYLPSERTRDSLFKEFTLAGITAGIDAQKVKIKNPYWGGEAAQLRWDGDSLPRGRGQAFGSSDQMIEAMVEEAVIELGGSQVGLTHENLLPVMARRHGLNRTIDLLWPSVELSTPIGTSGDAETLELAAFARYVLQYAEANPSPAWLGMVNNNDEFTERLLTEVQLTINTVTEDENFGIADLWSRVKEGMSRLTTTAAATVTNPVVRLLRPSLNEKITFFVGDVFCYLQSREKHGVDCPIIKTVAVALQHAMSERSASDPLIIVGHSMGGNICYDLLTSFLEHDVHCDVLLTVGSQVPLFEELKLFRSSNPGFRKPNKVKRPANVDRWLNVYDLADVFSYTAHPVFEGIEDFEYSSGDTVLTAHGAYLLQPRFHQRLNRRLRRVEA